MAQIINETPRETVVTNQATSTAAPDRPSQWVYLMVTIVEILLAFRLGLRLLGASTSSPFVNFVYQLSYPFVYPFFGVFNTNLSYGAARLETETLVAMAVYAVVGYIIIALFRVARGRHISEQP